MITEEAMPLEEMKRAVSQGHLCAKCQGVLGIAWGGAYGFNGYILRCQDVTHEGITRHDKKCETKRRENFSMDSKALEVMSEEKMLERVNMARFPQDLTLTEKKLLAQVAITYGFDPLMGEITIYQGRPFVSIDGRYRKAQETGKLDGVETRPATKEERDAWQIPDGDYFFRSEVFVKEASRPFVAWGKVRATETKLGSSKQGDTTSAYKPIQSNPQRMAEKRAEAQALRKAFHIPLPSVEEIDHGTNGEDHLTGEVIKGQVVEVEQPKAKAKPKKETEDGEYHNESPEPVLVINDIPKVQNISELKSLMTKHKIGTRDALEIIGVGSFSDLVDLDEAWAKIKLLA